MTPHLQASIVWGTITDGGANPWIPTELLKPAAGSDASHAEYRRRERRYIVNQPAQLVAIGRAGGAWSVQIRDISPTGMQLLVEEAVSATAEVKIRWNGRQVNGIIRYNHRYDATLYRIGVELDARAEELMREVLDRQSEELRNFNLTLQHQAALARKYGALLDLTSEAITVVSPEGVVFFWNTSAERLYGWSRQEVIGRNLREFLRSDPPHAMDIQSEVCEAEEQPLRQVRKNGKVVAVTMRRITQRDPAGKVQVIVFLSQEAPAAM